MIVEIHLSFSIILSKVFSPVTFSGYPVYVLFVSYSYSTLYSYFDYVTKYRTGGFIFSSNQAALDYYIFFKGK